MVTIRSGRTYAVRAAPRRVAAPRTLIVPGFTRTGGNYGPARAARAYPGQELKFFDTSVNNAAFAAAGEIGTSLNLIAQGVGESQRVGRKCVVKSVDWKYNITHTASTSPDAVTVRLLVVLDKQANGDTPAVTDVLESANYQSFYNLTNKDRFRVLMDKTFTLNRQAAIETGPAYAPIAKNGTFHKACSIPIEFSAATGAIAEIRSNNLFTLQIADANRGTLDSEVRIRFTG